VHVNGYPDPRIIQRKIEHESGPEKISELYLLPVLEAVLAQLPIAIRGFQADNGSEYINHRVAEMLR